MATVFVEDWAGASAGTDISTGNSGYSAVKGTDATAKFDTTVQVGGKTQCAKVTTPVATTTVYLQETFTSTGERAWRRYFRADSLPTAATVILNLLATSTVRAQVRLMTDGTFQIRNATTAAGTSSFAVSAGETVRLVWHVEDTVVNELQIFHGANLHGSTPDETVVNNATYNQGTFDTFRQGVATTHASLALYFAADLDDDATFPGTAVDSGDAESPAAVAAGQNAAVTTLGGTSALAETASATAVAQDVSGSALASSMTFVGTAGGAANSSTASVVLPVLQADDLIVFGLAHIDTVTYSDPPGYSAVGASTVDGSVATRMWWKKAVAGDSQATLTIPLSATTKWCLCVDVLRGAHGTVPVESYGTPTTQTGTATTEFQVPAVSAPTAGSWLVQFVAERGTLAGQWTPPANRSERQDVGNLTGSGQSSACLADSNGAVSTGAHGAAMYTSTAVCDSRVGWTLVIAPSVTSGATSALAECATAVGSVEFDPAGQSISVQLSADAPVEATGTAGAVTVEAVNNSGVNVTAPVGAAAAHDGQVLLLVNAECPTATAIGLDSPGCMVAPGAQTATGTGEAGSVALPSTAECATASATALDAVGDEAAVTTGFALDPFMAVAPVVDAAELAAAAWDAALSTGPGSESLVVSAAALDATIGLILADASGVGGDASAKVAVAAGTA